LTDVAIDVVPGEQEELGLVCQDRIPDRLRLLLVGTGAESDPRERGGRVLSLKRVRQQQAEQDRENTKRHISSLHFMESL
jgi:hypothetical protein